MGTLLYIIIIVATALVQKKAEGKCRCPSIGGKVCGTNGVTYKNECRLRCAAATLPGLAVAAYTTCVRHKHPCICTNDYRPVCGTDGNTYRNQCEILCANTRDGKKSLNVEYVGDCTNDKLKRIRNHILTLISPYGKILPPDVTTTTDNTTITTDNTTTTTDNTTTTTDNTTTTTDNTTTTKDNTTTTKDNTTTTKDNTTTTKDNTTTTTVNSTQGNSTNQTITSNNDKIPNNTIFNNSNNKNKSINATG